MFVQLASLSNGYVITGPDCQIIAQDRFKVTHETFLPDVKPLVNKTKAPASKFEQKSKVVGMMSRFEFLELLVRIAKSRYCTAESED